MERFTNQHSAGGATFGLQEKDQDPSLLRTKKKEEMNTKRPEAIQFACAALYKFFIHSFIHLFQKFSDLLGIWHKQQPKSLET